MGCAPALQLANLTQQGLRDFYQQQFAPECLGKMTEGVVLIQ